LAVFRYPAIFLLNVFLVLGPGVFERQHLAEANRALLHLPAPKVATNSPLKRLPVRPPVHDPSTCAICIALHAPMAAQIWSAPSLAPVARAGFVCDDSRLPFVPIRISAEHCRGPPAA
jgi:hypothetical protein